MTTQKTLLPTKFITPEIVCSYPSLFEARENLSGALKFSLSCPIPKADKKSLLEIKQCIVNAAVNKWGEKAKDLKGIVSPMNDADEKGKDDEIYANTYYFNANSNTRPGVVDKSLKPIMAAEEVYPGCMVRASVNFYATDVGGQKRVAVGLNNVMKVADGEQIGGKADAALDFGAFATAFDFPADNSASAGDIF